MMYAVSLLKHFPLFVLLLLEVNIQSLKQEIFGTVNHRFSEVVVTRHVRRNMFL